MSFRHMLRPLIRQLDFTFEMRTWISAHGTPPPGSLPPALCAGVRRSRPAFWNLSDRANVAVTVLLKQSVAVTALPKPANNVGPWPASLGCTTNSYSSINPSSANACRSFTPATNSPLPDSRLSC